MLGVGVGLPQPRHLGKQRRAVCGACLRVRHTGWAVLPVSGRTPVAPASRVVTPFGLFPASLVQVAFGLVPQFQGHVLAQLQASGVVS